MTAWRRTLGMIPLLVTVIHYVHSVELGKAGNILWACHVSNVLLGFGILFNSPRLIQTSVPWIVLGIPLWIIDMIVSGDRFYSSFFSHIGGVIIGVYGIYLVRARANSWIFAFLYFLVVQGLARLYTDPILNVNVSHRIYFGMSPYFSNYWSYWLFLCLIISVALWITNKILYAIYAPGTYSYSKR